MIKNTGLFRPNLRYEVRHVSDENSKRGGLSDFLSHVGGTGIVYTATIKQCEELNAYLYGADINTARYHGRLTARERAASQDRFMSGELRAIVATNAFGVGIDKPDIRFVAHYNLSGSIETYHQESGRAGRDGGEAHCVLFFHPADRRTHLFFLGRKYPSLDEVQSVFATFERYDDAAPLTLAQLHSHLPTMSRKRLELAILLLRELGAVAEDERGAVRLSDNRPTAGNLAEVAREYLDRAARDRLNLEQMTAYAQTARCRWGFLLEHFGEQLDGEGCDTCDNCARLVQRPEPPPQPPRSVGPAISIHPAEPEVRLQPGDRIEVPTHGEAVVEALEGDKLLLRLRDGSRKKFKRAFIVESAPQSSS